MQNKRKKMTTPTEKLTALETTTDGKKKMTPSRSKGAKRLSISSEDTE